MTGGGEPSGRRLGYIIAIAVNIVLLGIVHVLPSWQLSFITAAWPQVLWAFDLAIGATIVANLLFLVYDALWFKQVAQIVLNVLGIVVVYTLYRVFPFDFGPSWANQLARLALLAALLGITIAIIVDLVSLMRLIDRDTA